MTQTYVLQMTKPFLDCQRDMCTNAVAIVALQETLGELSSQPFQNPKIQTHAFKGLAGPKTYISDVGGRKHWRLIWRLVGNTIVLLLFGEHDIEDRASRLRWDKDVQTGGVRIIEVAEADQEQTPSGWTSRPEAGRLFMAHTDDDLAAFGFEDQEIDVLRRLNDDWELERLEADMRPSAYERALQLYLYGTGVAVGEAARRVAAESAGSYAVAGLDFDGLDFEVDVQEQAIVAMIAEEREAKLEQELDRPEAREHFARLDVDRIDEILAGPIEDWMIFLHPTQSKLTQRPFSGPARVRGGAGTGKTVVALHRAKHLADTYREPVLVTTFVKNLPPVFKRLFGRLAPEVADHVDFRTLHSAAHQLLVAAGQGPKVNPQLQSQAWWDAWNAVSAQHNELADAHGGLGWRYYKDELDWVIKGRGIADLETYLALARTGRGTPLRESQRRAMWALYERYQQELDRRNIEDFADVQRRALALLEGGDVDPPYRAVVVDEGQDLTEVGVRLAHALGGGDRRDAFFLPGDGLKSVYPGGYSLKSVGVDVVGRSTILRTNYRNTEQILHAATRIVAGHEFDDLEQVAGVAGARAVVCLRRGPAPVFEGFATQDGHDLGLAAAIEEALSDDAIGIGDVGVLVPTNQLVDECAAVIRSLGLATMKLSDYTGATQELVKVGTYQRGKGLEFKAIFLPRLDDEALHTARADAEDEQAHAERLDLIRRQLFVAVTRARDHVWGGWIGEPTTLLNLEGSEA